MTVYLKLMRGKDCADCFFYDPRGECPEWEGARRCDRGDGFDWIFRIAYQREIKRYMEERE